MKFLEALNDEHGHEQAYATTGFWGAQGAGCIFFAKDTKRFLLAHRSDEVLEPNTWGTWGGAIDKGESPEEAVRREVEEEAGHSSNVELVKLWTFKHTSGFQYHNYLAIVEKEFVPVLNWETQGFKWVKYGEWPKNQHPGLTELLSHEKERFSKM